MTELDNPINEMPDDDEFKNASSNPGILISDAQGPQWRNPWIDLFDRTPTLHQDVLLYIGEEEDCPEYAIGYLESDWNFYCHNAKECLSIDCVKYWMPLPEPPK